MKYKSFFFFLTICICCSFCWGINACQLYLAMSSKSAKLGLFSATHIEANSELPVLNMSNHLKIRSSWAYNWQLFDYVYELDDESVFLVSFGDSNLLRSNDDSKLEGNLYYEYDDMLNIRFFSTKTIYSGDELVIDNSYNVNRTHQSSSSSRETVSSLPLDYLQTYGICLPHLYSDRSVIPGVGQGVYSTQSFEMGDVIAVSPVVILPRHSLERLKSETSLINYCISANNSDVALLPLSIAATVNHGGRSTANVEVSWYDGIVRRIPLLSNDTHHSSMQNSTSNNSSVGSDKVPDIMYGANLTVREALRQPVADLEKTSHSDLYVIYTASKHIPAGQEILLDYGAEWEDKWMSHHFASGTCAYDGSCIDSNFRYPIGAGNSNTGLVFPDSFQTKCIGRSYAECATYLKVLELNEDPNKMKRFEDAKAYTMDARLRVLQNRNSNGKSTRVDSLPDPKEPMFAKRKRPV